MKHRIVQFGDDTFILEEKKFLFWYNMNDKYSAVSSSFKSLAAAKEILGRYLEGREEQKKRNEIEKYRRDNVKIHYITSKGELSK